MDEYFLEEPTYTDIIVNIQFIQAEVENLDQDSLVDEVSGLQYNIKGKESEKIQHLIYKAYANHALDKEEIKFLKNIYVIYYCKYALVVDEPEEEEDGV